MHYIKSIILIFISTFAVSLQAQTIDIDQFLSSVRKHNKDLKLAEKELDIAGVNKKEALSTALPKIVSQAGYTRNLSDFFMYADLSALTGDEGGTAKFKVNFDNEFSWNTVINQTLFNTQVGSALKAAKQYTKLTDHVYASTLQSVMANAKKLYYQAILLQKVVQINEDSRDNALENYENIKISFENGLSSELELLQAEVRWKDTIPELEQAKRNYHLILNNLKMLAGYDVQQDLQIKGSLALFTVKEKQVPLEEVFSERHDYNAMLWERNLKNTQVESERGSLYPSASLTLAHAFSSTNNKMHLGNRNSVFTLGVNLSIPIFTGGYNRARIQRAKVELNKTDIEIKKREEQIITEVENISLRIEEARERIQSAEALKRTAEKAFSIAWTTSQNGLTTQLDLRATRLAFDQAQLNYYMALYDYLESSIDYDLATGKLEIN